MEGADSRHEKLDLEHGDDGIGNGERRASSAILAMWKERMQEAITRCEESQRAYDVMSMCIYMFLESIGDKWQPSSTFDLMNEKIHICKHTYRFHAAAYTGALIEYKFILGTYVEGCNFSELVTFSPDVTETTDKSDEIRAAARELLKDLTCEFESESAMHQHLVLDQKPAKKQRH